MVIDHGVRHLLQDQVDLGVRPPLRQRVTCSRERLKTGNPLNPQGVGSGETKWLVNDLEFNATQALHTVTEGIPEQWTIVNSGGGWVHPFHMHQEEHQTIARAGGINPHDAEDGPPPNGKEDVVAMDPGESVTFYRNFRTFCGKYVAHCHNLAHEDHAMMFGWEIVS